MHVELKMTLWEVAAEYEVTDEAVRLWVRKAERGGFDHIQISDDERDALKRRHSDFVIRLTSKVIWRRLATSPLTDGRQAVLTMIGSSLLLMHRLN